jgi:hypothetical protein
MKGEEDHFVSQVWLNAENIGAAYELAGREPKDETVNTVCRELLEALQDNKQSWAAAFLKDAYRGVLKKKSVGNRLPADPRERRDLIRALRFIGQTGETEILERVFSIRCFGDSKRFEKAVRSRLVGILSKYLDDGDDSDGESLLARIGIVKYPEQFEFCGNVRLAIGDKALDFSPLVHGAVINSADLRRGSIHIDPGLAGILTIENRANYADYLSRQKRDDRLVVFHGGQFSPAKGVFFKTLADSAAGCPWHHWGDIDYGGFSMLARLRREIMADILPYRMNAEELANHAAFAMPVSEEYVKRLDSLRHYPELADCLPCITYMIEHRVRLEQEALLS